jgi:hypothetical protein
MTSIRVSAQSRNPLIAKTAKDLRKERKVPIAIGMKYIVLTLQTLRLLCELCGYKDFFDSPVLVIIIL